MRITGDSFTLSKRPAAFPGGVWGHVTRGAMGTLFVRKPDGTQCAYMDWLCALGAVTVGYSHPRLIGAVQAQVEAGPIFSLPSRLEEIVADRICDVIPCAESVKVVKTGSEATSAAVRIARAATGRERIVGLAGAYHGWHDWWIRTSPLHPGVPGVLGDVVHASATIDHLLDDINFYTAAVIVEPEHVQAQLAAVRARCDYTGTLLIYDEMLSGGRLHLAGVSGLQPVQPDLATYGKALGGGYPFAFVCGKADLMEHAWPVSGTFSGDAIGLAAAQAMLEIYTYEPVISTLHANGAAAWQAICEGAQAAGFIAARIGRDPRFTLKWSDDPDVNRLAQGVFCQLLAKRSILVHPNVLFASAALSPHQVAACATVFAESAYTVGSALAQDPTACTLAPYLEGRVPLSSAR